MSIIYFQNKVSLIFKQISFCCLSATWQQLNDKVRQNVKDAVVADVNQSDMLSGTTLEGMLFDVITTCLCLHVAALTMEDFKKALQNIRYCIKIDTFVL